ncbi:hypothetical protein DL240_15405 [Lujinxingia litoralis]|uniref:Uncharacterized protein n=1 Tax=Lujinxingia litoralis TaxID=2211119 RepID=A0A328C360_9DELT|nr:hypothetical protein DL240_15405 [Lujinxingia litoralis]
MIWVHGPQGARAVGAVRYVEGIDRSGAERREQLERRQQVARQRAWEARRLAEQQEVRARWARRQAERRAELAAREARVEQVRSHLYELYAGPQCVERFFEPSAPSSEELARRQEQAAEAARQTVESGVERALEAMEKVFTSP